MRGTLCRYGLARRRTRGKTTFTSPKRTTALAVSSDDEDEDLMASAPWARQPVRVSAATRALAQRWLQLARFTRSANTPARGPPTVQEIEEERIRRVQASSGTKSRFGRK